MRLLFELNVEAGTALVLVTHDVDLAQQTQRIIRLRGGAIVEERMGARGEWESGKAKE